MKYRTQNKYRSLNKYMSKKKNYIKLLIFYLSYVKSKKFSASILFAGVSLIFSFVNYYFFIFNNK